MRSDTDDACDTDCEYCGLCMAPKLALGKPCEPDELLAALWPHESGRFSEMSSSPAASTKWSFMRRLVLGVSGTWLGLRSCPPVTSSLRYLKISGSYSVSMSSDCRSPTLILREMLSFTLCPTAESGDAIMSTIALSVLARLCVMPSTPCCSTLCACPVAAWLASWFLRSACDTASAHDEALPSHVLRRLDVSVVATHEVDDGA